MKKIIKVFVLLIIISMAITNFSIAHNNEIKTQIDTSNNITDNKEDNIEDKKETKKADENIAVENEEKSEQTAETKKESSEDKENIEQNEKKIVEKNEEKENKKIIENGIYEICSAVEPNMVISIENNTYTNSTNIVLNNQNDLKRQKFQITYDNYKQAYIIKTLYGNMALDVSWGIKENCSNIQIYENNDTLAQQWEIKELEKNNYVIVSKDSNKCIDIAWRKYRRW